MAKVDYFLKIEGVEGESEDAKHAKEIDLESWSWGARQSGTSAHGGGGGAGKVAMGDFLFVMRVNKASPKLMLACATGEHFPKAILTCRKAGKEQQEFLKYTFTDVLISSYQTGGHDSSDVEALDTISFNFAKIQVEYKPQNKDGSLGGAVTAGYDLKKNQKV